MVLPGFSDDNLNLQGEVFGQAPVQAEGSVCGQAFYFRARFDRWTFVIAPPQESVWDCQRPADAAGLFRASTGWGYQSSGTFSQDPFGASAMSRDEVVRLIRQEACAFLVALAKA
jgi:hypothetical protein